MTRSCLYTARPQGRGEETVGRLWRAGLCPGACWEGGVGLKAVARKVPGHLVDLC